MGKDLRSLPQLMEVYYKLGNAYAKKNMYTTAIPNGKRQ